MPNPFTKRREPFEFMLYLGILGSCLLFFFILFIFVKREFDNQDLQVTVPLSFWLSTLAIILSSGTLQGAKRTFANEKFSEYRLTVSLTFMLGLVFMVSQTWGWHELFTKGIRLDNDTAGSFVYMISGLHLVHSLGGLVALAVVLNDAYRNRTYVDSYVYSVNPPNQLRLKLTSIYWHFVDILWVVLFVFLLYHAAQN